MGNAAADLTGSLMTAQVVVMAAGLALFWMLETWLPLHAERPLRERLRHDGQNLSLAAINGVASALLFAGVTAAVLTSAERGGVGLLRWADTGLGLPAWLKALLALVLLDGWMYLWHRLAHHVPLLWRFHRVHHSDEALSVTSAARFHVGEIAISSLLRLVAVPLIGASLWHLLLYEAILLPVILFHHSDVRLPRRFEEALRLFIVTPSHHHVHHSDVPAETHSNFSSVLSVWDRFGCTFRSVPDPAAIHYGLGQDEGRPCENGSLRGLLRAPFVPAQPPAAKQGRRPAPGVMGCKTTEQ